MRSIVAAEERTRVLISALCEACGRTELKAVAPHRETGAPLLLIVDRPALLVHADAFPKILVEYSLCAALPLSTCAVTTYSLEEDSADYTARNLRVTPEGFTAFEIVGTGCIGRVRLQHLPAGGQSVILQAVGAVVACGVPFAVALSTLQKRCSG